MSSYPTAERRLVEYPFECLVSGCGALEVLDTFVDADRLVASGVHHRGGEGLRPGVCGVEHLVQVFEYAAPAGGADLGRGHVVGQRVQSGFGGDGFGGDIDDPVEPGVDAGR